MKFYSKVERDSLWCQSKATSILIDSCIEHIQNKRFRHFSLFIANEVIYLFTNTTNGKSNSCYYWNKHITAWKMPCTIFIHFLIRIEKLTCLPRLLVCFSILSCSKGLSVSLSGACIRTIKTNRVIRWIMIHQSDSVISPINNRGLGPASRKSWDFFGLEKSVVKLQSAFQKLILLLLGSLD